MERSNTEYLANMMHDFADDFQSEIDKACAAQTRYVKGSDIPAGQDNPREDQSDPKGPLLN